MNKFLIIAVSALSSFTISAGGALLAGMTGSGNADIPSVGVIVASVVTGAVAGARDVQKNLSEPPK